jgi:dinuclear metal center YbgI/SA1388 family protein
MNNSVTAAQLEYFLREYLEVNNFDDYGPNGLQIEGKETIANIGFAVSADLASIEVAVQKKADALIVHHGLFWKFHGSKSLTGTHGKRVLALARHHINLFGYHLPLDAHFEVGNAAAIARRLGLVKVEAFGDHKGAATGVQAQFSTPVLPAQLQLQLQGILNHPVVQGSHNPKHEISTVGIITGGASGDWREAHKAGLDAYITGELKEHDWSEAQEAGLHIFGGGHYATEQFGVQDLMDKLQQTFPVKCFFIPSQNPA